MKAFFSFCSLLLLISAFASAQSVGTVQGTITDPTGAVVPNATVTITSAISGYKQTTTTNDTGAYRFTGVPYQAFTVHAEAVGFNHGDSRGELRSNVPLTVNLQLGVAAAKQEVEVTEEAPLLETTSAGTHHDLDASIIERAPIITASGGVERLVQTVPGVVQDENGGMHPRGSESQVQYVVDGMPITDNMSSGFSTSLSAGTLRSAEVITGNVPAEYGGKLAAVVTVNTKSGLEMPWSGNLEFGAGSYGVASLAGEFGGHTKNFGMYVNSSGTRSGRYLESPEIISLHNRGGNARLFTKFDWNANDKNLFHLTLGANGTDAQIPNRIIQQQMGQRQNQELRDDSETLAYDHVFSPQLLSNIVVFRRTSTARLLDPDATGFPFVSTQARRQRTEGLRSNLSYDTGKHNVKFGFEYKHVPLRESFTLSTRDPLILADPTDPVSAFPVTAPFVFNGRKTGREFAFYAQDRFQPIKDLTVDVGLRYDHYDYILQDDAWSPRIGLAYHVKPTKTVLRAAYNRWFQPPQNEGLLVSSAPQLATFATISNPFVRAVPSERTNFYELGVQQQIGKHIRLDLSRYVKTIHNFQDKDQFLDTPIFFPIAIARGDVRGQELRIDLAPVHGFSGYVSYANSIAVGTTPLVGGIFLGEEDPTLLTPGTTFYADHDQRNTATFGVTYNVRKNIWTSFTGRYESGTPSEIDPVEFAALPRGAQLSLDPARGRVKPRTIMDLSAGWDALQDRTVPVTFLFTVSNLTDQFYYFDFGSVFSGTHVGRPREFAGRIVFHIKGKSKPGASSAGD
jgi:hypothetical protein